MSYITREDGEHFVIPSYRDVLSAKQKTQLKKDILMLSQSYGDYITLQKKNATQYEVAFSPDTGYLLGESIWHQFKRPMDMIYCEHIANTTEAILVIVKAGSVYLDGRFPVESIPEELIIFLTQQNSFEIYVYGDVPITEHPEEGKFSFEPSSVASFNILTEPVFPTLPLLKMYQLQLVDQVLKAQGIGVLPITQIATVIALLGLGWFGWWFFTKPAAEAPVAEAPKVNPYQRYVDSLTAAPPDAEMNVFLTAINKLASMPGWSPVTVDYLHGSMQVKVQSAGGSVEALNSWCILNGMTLSIKQDGMYVSGTMFTPKRKPPTVIYPLKEVIGTLVDRLARVYPGNKMRLGDFNDRGSYSDTVITLQLTDVTPDLLGLIGEQLNNLPLILQGVTLTIQNGSINGSLTLQALGT